MTGVDRKLVKGGLIGLVISIVVAVLPLLVTMVAGLIATMLDCQLDESGTSVCMLGSLDIGGELSKLGIVGWLSLITIPIGALAALLSVFVSLAGFSRYAWTRSGTETTRAKKLLWLFLPLVGIGLMLLAVLWFLSAF